MKKTILALAALAAGASAYAQDTAAPAKELAFTLDVAYVSDYIFRGVKLDGDSIQPSIEAAYGDFYAGIWHSNGIDDRRMTGTRAESETDLYAGYGLAINDTFSADFGVTRYTYSGNGASQFNTTEVYAGISADVLLSPSVYYYHDFDLEVNTYIASIGHSLPIANTGLSVDLSASYGWVQIPEGDGGDYSYWGFGASVPYALSETATLTAGVNYTHIDRSNFEPTQDRVVFSLGLSVGF